MRTKIALVSLVILALLMGLGFGLVNAETTEQGYYINVTDSDRLYNDKDLGSNQYYIQFINQSNKSDTTTLKMSNTSTSNYKYVKLDPNTSYNVTIKYSINYTNRKYTTQITPSNKSKNAETLGNPYLNFNATDKALVNDLQTCTNPSKQSGSLNGTTQDEFRLINNTSEVYNDANNNLFWTVCETDNPTIMDYGRINNASQLNQYINITDGTQYKINVVTTENNKAYNCEANFTQSDFSDPYETIQYDADNCLVSSYTTNTGGGLIALNWWLILSKYWLWLLLLIIILIALKER